MSFMTFLMVGAGGAIGAVVRTFLSSAVEGHSRSWLMKGAFVVNIFACLIAGFLICCSLEDMARLAMLVGFCGGFSTMSSVNLDAVNLYIQGHKKRCFIYLVASYGTSLLSAALGFALASLIL